MSTNGYSLTSEAARLLRSYSINNLSITIDGIKSVHDFRRPLIDGRGIFDTVINNILVSCKSIPIDIRINVDKHNTVALSSLMTYLKEQRSL